MTTTVEFITWHHLPECKLPDPDITVLICLKDADEPSWMGWHDGTEWRQIDGSTVAGTVIKWADMPIGEANRNPTTTEPSPC
jgi:hypothetical protein